MPIYGVVLAAGYGKRMKSKLYKVLHPVCGKPMIGHVVETLENVQVDRNVVVIGHGADAVRAYLGDRVEYALQEQQLGTGHAVGVAAPLLSDEEGTTIVICGDTPLVSAGSLDAMIRKHIDSDAACTIMTAVLPDPTGYGRVIRGADGKVDRIVEHRDADPNELEVREINTGTYIFDNRKLFESLQKVSNDNAQGEYYLTDVIGILTAAGETIEGWILEDRDESIGVNDRIALAEAEAIMRKRIARRHMVEGVTIIDPENTYIEADVVIGVDTVIYPGTRLAGNTVIGSACTIGPHADLEHCTVEDDVVVKHSVLHQAVIRKGATVGPFSYVRPGSQIGENVKIGDFVEIKNASIAAGSKVSHLAYIGDADVGHDVNIGCGAITANYDGFRKHRTVIEDGAFIGSNVNMIAPITIGKEAYVVAGTTVTNDVPDGALAIGRVRQTNKPDYADKIRARLKAKENE